MDPNRALAACHFGFVFFQEPSVTAMTEGIGETIHWSISRMDEEHGHSKLLLLYVSG